MRSGWSEGVLDARRACRVQTVHSSYRADVSDQVVAVEIND
jgi:hypothetical protein